MIAAGTDRAVEIYCAAYLVDIACISTSAKPIHGFPINVTLRVHYASDRGRRHRSQRDLLGTRQLDVVLYRM